MGEELTFLEETLLALFHLILTVILGRVKG